MDDDLVLVLLTGGFEADEILDLTACDFDLRELKDLRVPSEDVDLRRGRGVRLSMSSMPGDDDLVSASIGSPPWPLLLPLPLSRAAR